MVLIKREFDEFPPFHFSSVDFLSISSFIKWFTQDDCTLQSVRLSTSLILLILFAVLLTSCTQQDVSGVYGSSFDSPSKESWNVQIVLSQAASDVDESFPRVRISADHVQWIGRGDSTIQYLYGVDRKVEIEIFDSTGVQSAFLEADRVTYHEKEEYFTAEGNVRIETTDQRMLTTDWLEWWESDHRLRTHSFVTIRTPDEIVSGVGLEATEDLGAYQIGRFQAKIIPDS